MLTLLHSIIDREEHEKYLFLPLYGKWKINLWQGIPTIDESQHEKQLQLLDLPWCHKAALLQIITYVVVEKGMENKGKLW